MQIHTAKSHMQPCALPLFLPHVSLTEGGCDSVTVEGASLLQDGQTFPGQVKLVTMGQDTVHGCVQLACNEEDQARLVRLTKEHRKNSKNILSNCPQIDYN